MNLVDRMTDPPSIRIHSMTQDGRWVQARSPRAIEVVTQIWRKQVVEDRRDLDVEDRYAEAVQLDRGYGHHIRSVIDVPFLHGTLAVNSTQPDAFSPADLEILQEMAHVLSKGFTRMEDFCALEQHNRELEERYHAYKQTELKQDYCVALRRDTVRYGRPQPGEVRTPEDLA